MQFHNPLPDTDVFSQLKEQAASEDRITAAVGRMLLELVEYLQSRGPTPEAGIMWLNGELMIILLHPTRHLTVWVDAKDYGEFRDGLPAMYYRLQISTPGVTLSDDVRAYTVVEAATAILCA